MVDGLYSKNENINVILSLCRILRLWNPPFHSGSMVLSKNICKMSEEFLLDEFHLKEEGTIEKTDE